LNGVWGGCEIGPSVVGIEKVLLSTTYYRFTTVYTDASEGFALGFPLRYLQGYGANYNGSTG
jgi:hypothetical protein